MTAPSNTYNAFSTIGIREDLSDVVYNISPTDTPFLNGAAKAEATNTFHEWQTDALAANADNKAVEGDDPTAASNAYTTRLGNRTQIAQKTTIISGTLEAVKRAGRKEEMAYQLAKRSKEIKRDMETTLVGTNKAPVTGNSTTARELAPILAWIVTNYDKASDGSNPATSGSNARTDGTTRAFTETMLKSVLKQAWTSGGNPKVIMVGGTQKQTLSTFTGNATRMNQADSKEIIAAIDVYVSDFGELKTVPNRFMRTREALVLDLDYWAIAYLRPFQTNVLAKTGDSEKRQLLCEYTLESRNEAASGIVADLS